MADNSNDFSKFGFIKTFVFPGLLVFLIPVIGLAFFLHAQSQFNRDARTTVLAQIRSDDTLSDEERAEYIQFYTEVPFSKLLTIKEFAAQVDGDTRFHYATFRWMIRLSIISILASIVLLAVAGICEFLSLRSQRAQYLSLSIGWHVLRIFGALQAIVQAILLVALSFWVTALWFNVYLVRLILIVGVIALMGVAAVVAAIFKKVELDDFVEEGTVIDSSTDMPLWNVLSELCAAVGTDPPQQVIAGISDQFYVTEQPVVVNDTTYQGRTLFVSLSMLKQMRDGEAKAVLAHEMAHFSGKDTLYSKKIAPLMLRFDIYLQSLFSGGIATLPVFYFMNCFRALYQLSLSRHSREREFRADRIAADTTSPSEFAAALLRVVAYSHYRNNVEHE